MRRGVSLEEIARTTHVALPYLEALESDDFASLPEPVFTKGFIRAYCQVLRERPDEALRFYGSRPGATPAEGPLPARGGERRALGALVVSFVLLLVLGAALLSVTLGLQAGRERSAATAPVGSAAPPPGPAPEAPPAPTPPVSSAPASAGPARGPFRLVARTSERTWISVRTGGGQLREETIPAGEVREWVSSEPFVVTVGNAGGITLELDGRRLPPLGERGAVVTGLVLPPDGR